MDLYKLGGLEGRDPVACKSIEEWAQYFDEANRHVARDVIKGVTISTVFLVLDHNWGDGPPILFETMVFGGVLDRKQERYTTWEKAVIGHEAIKAGVKASAALKLGDAPAGLLPQETS